MANGNTTKFDSKEFLLRATVGLAFVLLFSGPAFWALLKDQPNRLQTIVVYVAIALISGIAFSVATVSQGKLQWGKLGISLGGGAAIGVATIVIVHRLLPLPPPLVLLQPTASGNALLTEPSPDLRVRRLQDTQEFLIEILRSGEEHEVSFLVVEGDGKQHRLSFAITDDGRTHKIEAKP